MAETELRIRRATLADAESILDIYRPYVEETVITFEYLVPSLEEFRERIAHTLEKYPCLVAERDSAHFHEHLGYRLVGEFHKCGYKFGRWYDMIWMEKLIGDHTVEPKPVVPFPELDELTLHECGIE